MSGKIGVLALQGDVREHISVLAELGAHPVEVRRPEDLAGIDGIVVPGGESTTMALLLDSAGLRQPLAERLRGGMPAFGTCAGMILLAAEVLDGRRDQAGFGVIDISVRRNGVRTPGRLLRDRPAVPELGAEPVHGVFIRAPLVERAGDCGGRAGRSGRPAGRVPPGSGAGHVVPSRAVRRSSPSRPVPERCGLMSGHSKWATIKHKKGAQDKARGKLFAKLIRQVEVAAREGGGDPDANPTLRTMFQKARDSSVPMDTIDRAIKRGTGELEGVRYEPVTYEALRPVAAWR